MTKRFRSLIPLFTAAFALVIMGQGCFGGTQEAGPAGGLFRTSDAQDWAHLTVLNLGDKLGSIANVGTTSIALDPQDPGAIYVGTVENGVIYSLDGGESWNNPKDLSKGKVVAIAVHPKNKCIVYAARLNQIMKTDNCQRDWKQAFFDARTDKRFTSIAVDWFNPSIVYATTNDGDVVKSQNDGKTWTLIHRLEGTELKNIVIDPFDSRIVYVSAYGQGMLKTTDAGENWELIRDPFTEIDSKTRRSKWIAVDPSNQGRIYQVSDYGILRSDDRGATFQALTLPSPPNSVDILAFAVHPKDPKTLVYATERSVVLSTDAGTSWTSERAPTTRPPAALIYDENDPPRLFLAPGPAPSN